MNKLNSNDSSMTIIAQAIEEMKYQQGKHFSVFCQALFPKKSVKIPCFRQGIFPAFGGH